MTQERQNYDRDFKPKAVELSFARGNAVSVLENAGVMIYVGAGQLIVKEAFDANKNKELNKF